MKAGAGLAVYFSISACTREGADDAEGLPESLATTSDLDAWVNIGPGGLVAIFTGKVELGQGILTAFAQIAADEIDVPIDRIEVVSGDTERTPNEGGTTGSASLVESGRALRHACADARQVLLEIASKRFGVAQSSLDTALGFVLSADGLRVSYADLLKGRRFRRRARRDVPFRAIEARRHIGRPEPRRDLRAKVIGEAAFLHDQRPPGLLHGRVLRPPSRGAVLMGVNAASVHALPGVVAVVRDGGFLGVIAEEEYQAVMALEALRAAAHWSEPGGRYSDGDITWLRREPAKDFTVFERGAAVAGVRRHKAVYTRPFLLHGSIGPSAAIAIWRGGDVLIETHSQTVFDTASAIAEMLGIAGRRVRLMHRAGSGCYGHNGADDVAADAALLAKHRPGRPVRVEWPRIDEHSWAPFGSPMDVELAAELDASGAILAWKCAVRSGSHNARPGGRAGNLLPAQMLKRPFETPPPRDSASPNSAQNRNSVPPYDFAHVQVTSHVVQCPPLRVSALRSLGAFANVFAAESFMDELAYAAKSDPLAFRYRHLPDPRAREVLEAGALAFGWRTYARKPRHGRGLGYARYKNNDGLCAVFIEASVDLDRKALRVVRAVAAIDVGDVVNPDGLRNQIEGGILQSLSWSMKEKVRYANGRVSTQGWGDYPILTFSEAPPVDVVVINRPGEPFLGAGEAAQGPTAAALANAIFDACGQRLRDLPFAL